MGRTDTLVHQIAAHAAEQGHLPALAERTADGGWRRLTWADYDRSLREVASGLLVLGHEEHECVAIIAANRVDWVLCQMGIMAIRGIPAPIYTTLLTEQVAWIVDHSQSRVAICDGREQLDKLLAAMDGGLTPRLEKIVTMDDLGVEDERVVTLAAVRAMGREAPDTELDRRLEALTDDETAMLIYTSGTTGTPKAVQLDHRGMLFVADNGVKRFPPVDEVYRVVSYLPLCHIAEQLFTNLCSIRVAGEVTFCPDITEIRDYLVAVRPTVFVGVPRVWEKFQAVLEGRFAATTGIKGALARWAMRTELAAFDADVARGDRQVRVGLARRLARRLVLSKVTEALGLDQLKAAFTGAAPISVANLRFFASLGIVIYEGYGMSETSGIVTSGEHNNPKFGSVGRALDGAQLRIAEDGEILCKGPNMTRGYLRQPERTAELLDEDGWLHTGDLGTVDEEGWVRITGRKKDILITAGGKNVAPAEMEGLIKQIFGISQAVVVGDRKPYLAALVTVDPEALEELGQRVGFAASSLEEVATNDKFAAWLQGRVEEVCNAHVARYQTIKRVRVLPVEFSVDGGEVTPTMKVKRNVVAEKYAAEIEALFA